ncbi:MAG: hypothetical protein K8I27_05590 [Planctomycetes bacterium]|nr:hypothetical protein [Planctomycetota bacterium]
MDQKQKLLIRNIAGGVILLALVLFGLAYCGVFEGEQSDEAQIRALIERAQEEFNDNDYDGLFSLCDLTAPEKEAWINSVPKMADNVQIDVINPRELIVVPGGATEYQVEVSVIAHMERAGISFGGQLDAVTCTLAFVRKNERWYIDLNKSTFPPGYVQRPTLP